MLSSRQPGSQHKITPEFFTVLDKVARIKADCQVNIPLHQHHHHNMLVIVRFSCQLVTRLRP